jgi:hypothetical protein
MKKLIFLLLMAVAAVGLVSAATGAAHPPGASALEMVLSGYSVYENVVTPDTVLAVQPIVIALLADFQVVPVYNGDGLPIFKLLAVAKQDNDYWLRL